MRRVPLTAMRATLIVLVLLLASCSASQEAPIEVQPQEPVAATCWYLMSFQGAEPAWYRILAVDCTTTADCLIQRDGLANPDSVLSMAQNVTCAVERP